MRHSWVDRVAGIRDAWSRSNAGEGSYWAEVGPAHLCHALAAHQCFASLACSSASAVGPGLASGQAALPGPVRVFKDDEVIQHASL